MNTKVPATLKSLWHWSRDRHSIRYQHISGDRNRHNGGNRNRHIGRNPGQVTPVVYLLPKDVMRSDFFALVKAVTLSGENILSPKTKERGGNLAALLSLAKLLPQFAWSHCNTATCPWHWSRSCDSAPNPWRQGLTLKISYDFGPLLRVQNGFLEKSQERKKDPPLILFPEYMLGLKIRPRTAKLSPFSRRRLHEFYGNSLD